MRWNQERITREQTAGKTWIVACGNAIGARIA
jgi:hypothetical protein